jgi:hypothetical protein
MSSNLLLSFFSCTASNVCTAVSGRWNSTCLPFNPCCVTLVFLSRIRCSTSNLLHFLCCYDIYTLMTIQRTGNGIINIVYIFKSQSEVTMFASMLCHPRAHRTRHCDSPFSLRTTIKFKRLVRHRKAVPDAGFGDQDRRHLTSHHPQRRVICGVCEIHLHFQEEV